MKQPDDIQNINLEFENNPELKQFLDKIKNLKVPAAKSKSTAWEEFVRNLDEKQEVPVRRINYNKFLPLAIAASLILFVISWFVFQKVNTTEIIVSNGTTNSLILPDNTNVTVNSGSVLTYKNRGFKKNRIVKLKGEALFDVKLAGNFTVEADQKKVEVLGTRFNVFSRGNDFQVQCLSGKVKVDISESKEIVLNVGEGVKKTTRIVGAEKFSVDMTKSASWVRGEFFYESAPLSEVIEELERQFDVIVQFPDTGKRIYTGYFKNDDLKTALENICLPMFLHFEISGKNKVKIW